MRIFWGLVLGLVWLFEAGWSGASVAGAVIAAPAPQAYIPPVITVWYGDEQIFTNGSPQDYINIVGNVNGGDSQNVKLGVSTLTYTLNGSAPRTLTIGYDYRRLTKPGDFNIDIPLTDSYLVDGRNTVVITATNRATPAQTTTRTIYFTYDREKTWELPYVIDWSAVTNLQDAVQVVDGHWRLENGGIRVEEWGYDRVLAIGERTWTNYEVLVPFTLNAIDETKYYSSISVNPGIGVNLRWLGHTDTPVRCSQPKCGWEPTGASNWYEFWREDWRNQFMLFAGPPANEDPKTAMKLLVGSKYWLRASVESNSSGTLYQSKLWLDGTPEPAWMLTKQTDSTNLSHGSFLLVAHHVDVTFGNIVAVPIGTGKRAQFIQVSEPAPAFSPKGSSFTVKATASSNLPVVYSSGSPDVCTYQNGVFSVIKQGASCIVRYTQPGDAAYLPAPTIEEDTWTGYNYYIPSIRR